ncbi:MAG: hypothetical protein ACRD12_14735 [Acidimicrobiales bacterium]
MTARRLTPVDAAALGDLQAKLDRLIVMLETGTPMSVASSLIDDGLRNEVRAGLAGVGEQFEATLNGVIQRMADETVSMRSGLQMALDEAQRREVRDRESVKSALEAAFSEVLERQGEDKESLRVQVQAAMADAHAQLRADLHALVVQAGEPRGGGQQQLRAAFDTAIGDQKVRADVAELKETIHGLEAVITTTREELRRQLQTELEAALVRRDQQLGALLGERWEAVNEQLRGAVEDVIRQQAAGWESRRAELEAALADGNDQLQQALAEENARLRSLEAALLGQAAQNRMQWRADLEAALTAGRDVAVALVNQATERLMALGEEVARSITKSHEERTREQGEQLNDLQTAFEDLTSAIGLERRELRAAVEAGLDTSDLVERLDQMTASTAKGAKDVALAIDKLRRRPRTDSRVNDLLMELYEELETLRRKIPARSELRLADDQMAAILAAVKAARPGAAPAAVAKAAPAPGPAPAVKAVKAVKRAPRRRPAR